MKKPEDNPYMKVLKTATCKTISAKSTLTYQVGSYDDELHVRITKNTGGGFFSDEWISMDDIKAVLDEHPEGTPVTSFMLQPIFKGRSVNTPAFLLSTLVHEKLLRPIQDKKRSHEPAEDFTAIVEKLTSSTNAAKKKVTSKRPTKKAVTKKTGGTVSRKAPVKKKATARKKTARTV